MNKIIIFSSKYLDSHTSYFHQEADSYQNNGKAVDADGKEYETIAPLFIGFNSNVINQRFDIKPAKNFSMYAGGSYSYKLTDRPDSRTDITGGSDMICVARDGAGRQERNINSASIRCFSIL